MNFLRAIIYSIILSSFLWVLPDIQAHPHVFIVQRLSVVFDKKGLAGIKVHWKFDDMFASMIANAHDMNKNGILEKDEVKLVKEKAFILISEDNYFTFIKIEKKPFLVNYIEDFNAILEKGGLIYEFFIPCHVIATEQFKKIAIATYDPTYYTAILFAKKDPVFIVDADTYDVKTAIREDPENTIYYGMVHPWTLFMEFKRKP